MITQERLKQVLRYNASTGVFTWVSKPAARSNRVKVGTEAGITNARGYRHIGIDQKKYLAHRLAWLYMTGECPKYIDHINGVPGDDRWANLRSATMPQNGANSRLPKNNTSGLKGVSWAAKDKKWRAQICSAHIGYFDTAEDAHTAYMVAARERFGNFARAA